MRKKDTAKRQLFSHFAAVAKALASAPRLELLEALAQGERAVEALATAVGLPVANTSHHLHVLRQGGLVKARREGVQIFYRLSDPEIPTLLANLRGIGERHVVEVERVVREHFSDRDDLTPVGQTELLKRVKSGEATVIDVRPPEEYQSGHIKGAINIPLAGLSKRLSSLPKNQEIVAYCRGPYCMLAYDAVAQLRKRGYRARRLEDGFPEWLAAKRPVESGK